MEKLIFKKIELWIFLVLFIFTLGGAVVFAGIVRNVAYGNNKFGAFGRAALTIAALPSSLQYLLAGKETDKSRLVVDDNQRFPNNTGWEFDRTDPSNLPDGFLLFSRYDGDISRTVIELIDLQTGDTEHRIVIEIDTLLEGVPEKSELDTFDGWSNGLFRAIHPYALANGDILVKDHATPLVRVNPCGQKVWVLDNNLYHHSTEIGADGNLWSSTHIEPTNIEGLDKSFFDNSMAKVSPEGEILYERSMADVFMKSGLGNWLFALGNYADDPIHLNDVQPVLEDGPYWKKGDLFLTLRHLSTIVLFRPSTDEIIWMQRGPWTTQHDVDIINDHTIGVFSNNTLNFGQKNVGNRMEVQGSNEVLFFDFATDTVTSPFKDLFLEHDIRTPSEGLFSLMSDGYLLVEETDAGRTMIFSPDGKLAGQNVNRASDGSIYLTNWSRLINRQEGEVIRDSMQATNCS